MVKKLLVNNRIIEYDLVRKRVKNLNLRVKRDKTVCVSAPKGVSESYVDRFVASKTDFIERAIKRLNCLNNELCLKNDSEICVFGCAYRIKIVYGNKNSVSTDSGYLTINVKENDELLIKKTFIKWLKKQTENYVGNLCESVYPKFCNSISGYPTVKYKSMTSRWGSCNKQKQTLTFNYSLAFLTERQILYVVYHEFTHFIEMNHSRKFYAELEKHFPDYKTVQKEIRRKAVCPLR